MQSKKLVTLLLLLSTSLAFSAEPLNDALRAMDSGRHAHAAQLLLPLANGGNPLAQYRLGMMYYNGQGVPEDEKQSIYWWKKAAAQGYVEAMFQLGSAYLFGSQTAKFVPDPDREAAMVLPGGQRRARRGPIPPWLIVPCRQRGD